MSKNYFQKLHKDYGTSGLVTLLLVVFFVGGLGSLFLGRLVFPRISNWPVIRSFNFLQQDAPIVINRREEVRVTDGVNQTEIVNSVKDSLVTIYVHRGEFDSGSFQVVDVVSGVAVSSDGLVIAPSASLRSGFLYTVANRAAGVHPARLLARDALTGIAILKIDADKLPIIKQGFSEDLAAGSRLLAVSSVEDLSNPDSHLINLQSAPLLSPSLFETYSLQELNIFLDTDWQTQASDLGSPVLNSNGEMVGFLARIKGTDLIVRSEDVRAMLNNFLDDGVIIRSLPAFSYQVFGETQADVFSLDREFGFLLKSNFQGLRADDFVYAVEGTKLSRREGLQEILLDKQSGDVLEFSVIRDGEEREVNIEL